MTASEALSAKLSARILRRFGLPAAPHPDLATLQALIAAYTRSVPWESASRVARRARHEPDQDCALFGADFWESHFALGTGGTCYESNYAFFGLLLRLGYEGYLTINDMGESIGCHSAIVIFLDERKYLVDVGFPLYIALPLPGDGETQAACAIMRYSLSRNGSDQYQLRRELGKRVHGFALNDKPVDDAEYRAIGIHDYRHDGGQFLNEIVIHRIVDERLWRFHSDVEPLCLQEFVDGERHDRLLGADPAAEVAAKFGMARAVLAEAWKALGIGKT